MRTKNQHIAAFVLGAVVALPMLVLLLLQGWQLYLKQQAWQRLGAEVVQTIMLPLQQVQWEEKEKELVVNGRLFDIQSYSIDNGLLTVTGVYDEEETNLLQFFLRHSHPEKAPASLIQLLLLSQCFIAFVSWFSMHRIRAGLQKLYTFYAILYCNPIAAIASPPPRFYL